jgi:hypothetical protein
MGTQLEYGADSTIGQGGPRFLQAKIEGNNKDMPPLAPPADRGRITIADVHGAEDVDQHAERVREWASCVWESWREHHDWVRNWLKEQPFKKGMKTDCAFGTALTLAVRKKKTNGMS